MEELTPQSNTGLVEKVRAHLPQIMKFLVSGGTATLVHLFFFWVFKQHMHIIIATTLGFMIGFVVSFTLQKFWTFSDNKDKGSIHKQGAAFFTLQISNLIANGLAVYVLVTIVGMWDMLAQFLVLGTLAVSTFIVSKLFIFNGK